MSSSNSKADILKKTFGFDGFRPNQEVLVEGVLAGRDVFGVMPTGGGKSLCYQLPALMLDGCCIVVSPLIALMKDQVDSATTNGIRAACLNSSLSAEDREATQSAYRNGQLDMLYVAPERLSSPGFVNFLGSHPEGRPSFFAIDEAHCISEWGHDFRPDYMFLGQLKTIFRGVPVVAFTATATEQVAEDIESRLGLVEPVKVRASFDRSNLFYDVRAKRDWQSQLVEYVKAQNGASGVIYRTTRKSVEETAALLCENGIDAKAYHAGMDPDYRATAQDAFIRDDCAVMVATVAFGMGIDKSDVRFVVHVDLPKNMEGYYQETGRAGRDGEPSRCLLLHSSGDVVKLSHFISQIEDEQEQQRSRELLRAMDRFAAVPQCRRKALLGYFNEVYPKENCGACDFCAGEFQKVEATRPAQILLSAVARTKNRFGAVHLCDIVTGANTAKIRQFEHEKLKTYGMGKDQPKAYWRKLLDSLLAAEYLALSKDQFSVPQMTQTGWDLMMGKGDFFMQEDTRSEPERINQRRTASGDDTIFDTGLFEHLRLLRKEIADLEEVAPYLVFGDRTLRQLASLMPVDLSGMSQIHGIGSMKLEKYGERFSSAVRSYIELHPEVEQARQEPLSERAKQPSTAKARSKRKPSTAGGTYKETLSLIEQGLSLESIADKRGLGISTVESHIARLFEDGASLNLRDYVSEEQETIARQLFEKHGLDALKPIVEGSKGEVGYGVAKIVRSMLSK